LERFAAGSNFEGLILCFLLFLGVLEAQGINASGSLSSVGESAKKITSMMLHHFKY
jgi:hypothetical protein